MRDSRLARVFVTAGVAIAITLTGSTVANAQQPSEVSAVLPSLTAASISGPEINPDDIVRPRGMPIAVAVKLAESANGSVSVQSENPVVTSWLDLGSHRVYARANAVAKWKAHGLTTAPVRAVTQWTPDANIEKNGTSWAYQTEIGNPNVGWQPVRVIVDFKTNGSQTFGVVTAYCTTGQVCPSWVNSIVG